MPTPSFTKEDCVTLSATFNVAGVRKAVQDGYTYAVMGDGLLQKDSESYAKNNKDAQLKFVAIPVRDNDTRDVVFFNSAKIARDFYERSNVYKDFGILEVSLEKNNIKVIPAKILK